MEVLLNILVPLVTGIIYFGMAWEVSKVGKIRKIMFGEIGYKKMFITFILLGITIAGNSLQFLKAYISKTFNVSGRFISINLIQFSKALSPIFVKPSDKYIRSSLLQFLKTFISIIFIFEGTFN